MAQFFIAVGEMIGKVGLLVGRQLVAEFQKMLISTLAQLHFLRSVLGITGQLLPNLLDANTDAVVFLETILYNFNST